MVIDLRVHLGLNIISAIGDRRVSCVEFNVLYAICDTAERKGLIDVRKGTAVNSNAVHQCGNTKLLSEIIADPWAEFGEDFYSDDIHGLYNSLSES